MKYVLLLIFIEILFGCDHDQPIVMQTFSGQVIDYSTGLPIANANVQLIRATEAFHPAVNDSDLRNQYYHYTATDASGNF